MGNIQYTIVNIFAIILEGLSIWALFDKVFLRKFKNGYIYFAIIPYTIIGSLFRAFISSNILSNIISVFIIMLIALVLYSGSYLKRIFYSVFIYALFLTVDFVLMGIFMILFNIELSDIIGNTVFMIFATTLSKISLFIIIKILCQFTNSKSRELLKKSDWVVIFTIMLVTLLIIGERLNESLKADMITLNATIDIMCIICLNISLFSIIERMMSQFTIEQEKNNLAQQVKLEMKNIEILKNNQQKIRELSHNLSSSLSFIKASLIEDDAAKALEFIGTIINEAEQNVFPVCTNNIYIDTILAQKYALANDNKIKMRFEVCNLSNMLMDDIDLVTILANALDNAIESCLKDASDIPIFVKIVNGEGQFVVSVKNHVFQPVIIINDSVKTSKSDKQNHGIGLTNIKNIVKKYNGDLFLSCENLEFRMIILINTTE